MSTDPLEREFVLDGELAHQIFSWLTPYIEKAGYKWTLTPETDTLGKSRISVKKETV